MVNTSEFRTRWPLGVPAVLVLAAVLLTSAAWLRGAEYDEQYTLFLTAGTPRPDWPNTVFSAGSVAAVQAGQGSLSGIGRDLRATDVHPPLYFWLVSLWRGVAGPGLFAARMLSVLCGVGSIGMVGVIARRCAVRPALAMLMTLGCYGFVYTNAVARGFAPAMLLTLCGTALLLGRRPWLSGVFLGAACCCNYLAVFAATAVVVSTGAWLALPAAMPFLALDAWFFAAQHAARPDQFPPFRLWASLVRLIEYQAAAVFGGLPLYLGGAWAIAAQAAIGLLGMVTIVTILRTPSWRGTAPRMLLAAASAPAAGLLLLGAVFNNTPIELRYLCFGLPFLALLAARCLPPAVRRGHASGIAGHGLLLALLLTVEAAGVAGLLFSPRTMQPGRPAATAAARLAGDALLLLPAGNDGVGIVGAFSIEAPASLPILLVHPDDRIAERIAGHRRVALALIEQDRDSVAAVANLRATFIPPNWRRVAIGSNLEVFERTDTGE